MAKKTALVLIDLQNDYFPGGAMELVAPDIAAATASHLLSHFRNSQQPVIHIQHIALQEGATFFLPNTPGAAIHQSVHPLPSEKVITKHFPNSFRDTALLEYLQAEHITHLVFCGMMTDICIDATVRAAFDLGFENTIISDAVTTRNRELHGETIPAGNITKSFLAGLNALGGLYTQIQSGEQYLTK
ncbi:nicotinamidase-related amidase [Chitinophaga dinghuensis]|uniref:Nicotinamidase-related amidase n=1 Tax=Chitinophaga dinghuensis TaxID=1539050 RepID=A0A327W5Z1_9BACT|nr:cysteine hydrolase family protein [Chitinophaga dinghuensis]RAJ83585.1 nicotinamidase-related amidase [Chitinophaga dinghuensis]